VVGENLFIREAALWPASFTFRKPSNVFGGSGRGNARDCAGKKSGIDSIAIKAKELGISLTTEDSKQP